MILDSLTSFERYVTLHASFGKVLDFIKNHDLHTLPDGKHIIEEGNIWCSVSSSEAREPENAPLEAHDSFIDIHVILEGTEIIGFRDRARCMGIDVKYDETADIAFLKEKPEAYVSYSDDNFIICFPQDCHAPLIGTGTIRKAVFKVRL
ncbi:MAG TPA: YhcH/YjgK/YiaL family protein [Candidatus Coprenecus stercoravium]|uniref:YhcH/YjgK/YiaL family protein n=1 Tax=Candidatus Coprenecus stercoravium TaxID=2840735 RepID=A0A9D2GQQ1_9BACT|nr:YhcH/YjgK/YiaL family protein [Candidatus Coprenecus stercoravium]